MAPAVSTPFDGLSRPHRADSRRPRATKLSYQPLPVVHWDKIAAGMTYNLLHGISTISEVFFDLLEFVPTIHCGRPGAVYLVETVFNALLAIDAAIAMEYLTCTAELSIIKFYGYWSVCTSLMRLLACLALTLRIADQVQWRLRHAIHFI